MQKVDAILYFFEEYSNSMGRQFSLYTAIQGLGSFQFIIFVLPLSLSLSHFWLAFIYTNCFCFSRSLVCCLCAMFIFVRIFCFLAINSPKYLCFYTYFPEPFRHSSRCDKFFATVCKLQFLVVVARLLTPWYPFCLPPALRFPFPFPLPLPLPLLLLAKSTSVSATIGGPQETCRRTVAGPTTVAPPAPPLPTGFLRLELVCCWIPTPRWDSCRCGGSCFCISCCCCQSAQMFRIAFY